MDDRALLERIARAVGVTPTDNVREVVHLGKVYRAFQKTQPPGRAWQLVRALLRPFVLRFWRTPCDQITVSSWLEHIAKRRTTPTRSYRGARKMKRGHRPASPATLNLERIRAIQLLNFGVDTGMIPPHVLTRTKPLKARHGRETRLTREQFDTLIANAHALKAEPGDDRPAKFRALMLALCDGMMRIGEARRIRRDRIGLDGKYVIPASQSKSGEARLIVFTPEALEAFAAVEPYPGSPYVIPSRQGKGRAYDANALREWVYTVAAHCGLNAAAADGDVKLKPHDLRATGASIAEENGATIRQIQMALGHSKPETTLRYLRRTRDQDAHAMATIMSRRRGPRRATSENEENSSEDLATRNTRRVQQIS